MKSKDLGVYMIITKEFVLDDFGNKRLKKEKMVFTDQTILSNEDSQIE